MNTHKFCLTGAILIAGMSLSGCAGIFEPISTTPAKVTSQKKAAPLTAPKRVAAKKVAKKQPVALAQKPAATPKPKEAPKVLRINIEDENDLFGGDGGGGDGGGGGGGWG